MSKSTSGHNATISIRQYLMFSSHSAYWIGLLESDCPTFGTWFMQEDFSGTPMLRNSIIIISSVAFLSANGLGICA